MELVDGVPLDAWLDAAERGRRERIELIVRIADAVDHAHKKGIIHRDLKPSNVLVTGEGTPRVLDFAVAQLLDAEAEASRSTASGQIVGTLATMSPELASGGAEAVDVRSDVYALGALLHRALAGRLPHDIEGLSIVATLRRIRDAEPPRLGTIDRTLRDDLEVIAAKALDRDPARRYASAAELAAEAHDLLAAVADEPRRELGALQKGTREALLDVARAHRALDDPAGEIAVRRDAHPLEREARGGGPEPLALPPHLRPPRDRVRGPHGRDRALRRGDRAPRRVDGAAAPATIEAYGDIGAFYARRGLAAEALRHIEPAMAAAAVAGLEDHNVALECRGIRARARCNLGYLEGTRVHALEMNRRALAALGPGHATTRLAARIVSGIEGRAGDEEVAALWRAQGAAPEEEPPADGE